MIRFMGFVTGAATAIGLMLFLFGLPELPETTEAELPPEPPAAEVAEPPLAIADATAVDEDSSALDPEPEPAPPAPEMAATPEPLPEPIAETPIETQPVAEPDALSAVADSAPATEETSDELPPDFAIAVGDVPLAADLKWHAFWSPFRSRIAADGFIGRLEAVTGFDYRVVKMDSGVYEVAFAYASDDERLSKLEAIEAATGLEMPGS